MSEMTVVDLRKKSQKDDDHSTGAARCLACKHEWTAVAPVGVTWMECPNCALERGRFIAQHARDGSHWHCKCGCDLFYATPDGFYCPNCGEWQHGF